MTSADHEPFLELLDTHQGILHRIARTYAWSVEDRRDLVQDMLVQLWRAHPRFDARCKFSTWMYRIALNVALSFRRQESLRAGPLLAGDAHLNPLADAPVLELQHRLAEIRRVQVRVGALALGLPWWVLWLPFLAMVLRSLFGADLYLGMGAACGWTFAACTLGWGLTFLAARSGQGSRLEALAAGTSLRRAEAVLAELARFEAE